MGEFPPFNTSKLIQLELWFQYIVRQNEFARDRRAFAGIVQLHARVLEFSVRVRAENLADVKRPMFGLFGGGKKSEQQQEAEIKIHRRCGARETAVKVCVQANSPNSATACDAFRQDLDLCKVSEARATICCNQPSHGRVSIRLWGALRAGRE